MRWVAFVFVVLAARVAHADELRIETVDGMSWSSVVEEVQDDASSEGRTFAIVVAAGGEDAACGDYTLALDEIGAAAFRIEGCDAATRATTLRVVNRAALFEPGDVVPAPRKATIHATMIARGDASGGGDQPRSTAALACTVALAPMLRDELHGVDVPLTPDRFDVRTLDADVDVATADDQRGWVARGVAHAALAFRYQAIDRATGAVVLTSTATLECADVPDAPAPAPAVASTDTTADLPIFGWHLMALTDLAWITRASPHVDAYGTSVGYGFSAGWFTYMMRYTIAESAQGMNGAWEIGVGAQKRLGPLTIYGAPALRLTMMSVTPMSGPDIDVEIGPALIVGMRARLGTQTGWETIVEASAPLRDAHEWISVIGFDYRFGR